MPFVPGAGSALEHASRVWFVVHPKGLVARRDGDRVALPTDADVAAMGLDHADAHRLGALDDADALAIPIAAGAPLPEPFEPLALRALAALLEGDMFAVVARALHAGDWLTTSRFCGRCGAATTRHATERCTVCPACALHTYPRISPAIITLVRKGDLALLASNAKFPGKFYSTLAGFAEIGETLEETLAREVREEAGIEVGNARYFGSQPWPFPNSLMIGFTADWLSGEIRIDPAELSDAQWFSVDALPPIPPPLSIARQLIDAWIADVRTRRA